MGKMSFWKKGKNIFLGIKYFFRPFYSEEYGLQLKAIWLGVTVALGTWFFTGAAGLMWAILSEAGTVELSMCLYLLGILGVLAGGIATGKKSSGAGCIHGLWVGIVLGIFSIIFNLELVPELYSWAAIGRQMLVWSLWGLTGGYIGSFLRNVGKGKESDKKRRYT
jgi:hypothetical protein